jgi:hypothetical protein
VAFAIGYPTLREAIHGLASDGIDARDLSELFLAKKDDIFSTCAT